MQDGIPLVGKDKLMSGTGAVWSRVRSRIQSFPERLATCGVEAAAYGKCVQAATAPGGELRRNLCAKEFEALRNCFVAVAKKTLN